MPAKNARMSWPTLALASCTLCLLIASCGGEQTPPPATPKKFAQKQQPATTEQVSVPPVSTPAAQPKEETPVAAPTPAEEETAPTVSDAPPPINIVKTALSMVQRGQYEAAIQQCKAALRRSEKYTPAMEVMARAYFHLGKTEFAVAICDIALGIKAKSGRCYNLKGLIALKDDDRQQAIAFFKKGTEVDPDFGPNWLNLGVQYVKVKNFSEAVTALEKSVLLMADRPESFLGLGAAYRGDGKVVKSDQALKKALKMRTNYPGALFNLGVLYLDAETFPGMTKLQQLQASISYFMRYRQAAGYRDKNDPVETYIAAAQRDMQREERRLAREARRKAREAAKAAAKKEEKSAPKEEEKKQ